MYLAVILIISIFVGYLFLKLRKLRMEMDAIMGVFNAFEKVAESAMKSVLEEKNRREEELTRAKAH